MINKFKKVLAIALLGLFLVGCKSVDPKEEISKLTNEIKNMTSYEVEYIEDRNVIRITDTISQQTVVLASTNDELYIRWLGIQQDFLSLHDTFKSLSDTKGIEDIKYELIIVDEESFNTDSEVPVLIVNEKGILFDMVERLRFLNN